MITEGGRGRGRKMRIYECFLGGGGQYSIVVVVVVKTSCWLVPLLNSGKAMF